MELLSSQALSSLLTLSPPPSLLPTPSLQLHAVAAYYPEHPAAEDMAAARGLIAAIARLYPCTHCRAVFAADVAALPPHLASREAFSLWMCAQHNRVNASLGKEKFPCTLKSLDERWRTGRPECWGGVGAPSVAEGQTAEESLGQAADEGV
jgi:hypothetical protein